MTIGNLYKQRYGEWVEEPVQYARVGSTDICVKCGGPCVDESHPKWFFTLSNAEPVTPEPALPVASGYARAPDPIVWPEVPMEWAMLIMTAINSPDPAPEPEVKPAGRGGFEFL